MSRQFEAKTFQAEEASLRQRAGRRGSGRGRAAVEQARLILLVMINIAQLWILSAIVEAVLAQRYKEVLPLIVASGLCWLIAVSLLLRWKPASRRFTSTGYVREKRP